MQKGARIKGEPIHGSSRRGIVKTKKSHYAFNYWLVDHDGIQITYMEPEFFYNRQKSRLVTKFDKFVKEVEEEHENWLSLTAPKVDGRGRPQGATNLNRQQLKTFIDSAVYRDEALKFYSSSTFLKSQSAIKMILSKNKGLGDKKLADITKLDINKALNKLNTNKRLKPQTLKRYKQFLSKPFEIAIKLGFLSKDGNPVSAYVIPKTYNEERKNTVGMRENGTKEDILSVSEMEIVKENIHLIPSKVVQTVVIFAILTGMRSGEINAVEWSDIDWKNKRINVYKTATSDIKYPRKVVIKNQTKGGETRKKPRPVLLYPELERLLLNYKQFQDSEYAKNGIERKSLRYDLIFCRPDGKPYSLERFSRAWRNYRDVLISQNKLSKLTTFHNLRGSFISKLLNTDKIPATTVQRLVGHKKISTTLDFYSQSTDDNLNLLLQELNQ